MTKIRFSNLPERLEGLADLAYNLWWSWHPEARMLFKMLDRIAWKDSGHNPVKMLKELPAEIIETAAKDREYLRHYDLVIGQFYEYLKSGKCWFSENMPFPKCLPIAYFSAEYGLHHSLPFYAGGLGFLAGDYLKECSDLGVPVVGIGFMYPGGYLRQKIRVDGWQEDIPEFLDRDAAPIERVFNKKEEQLIIKVPFIEPPIYITIWKVTIGRVPFYLMDTDIKENDPWNRSIAYHLYTGDIEQRLRQEMVLGIGGIAVLNTLGIHHSILHLNEGHSAFALFERIRERVEGGMSFEEAAEYVRSTSIFTTHTPVPAGHDVFPFHLINKYFGSYCKLIGIDREEFIQLGVNPKEPSAGFNMTTFSLKMSKFHNSVSKKHNEVTRAMWSILWPDKSSKEEMPIDYITNGIHIPTWIEPKVQLLFNKYLGTDWLEKHDDPMIYHLVDKIPDKELWQVHYWLKIKLINFIREQTRRRWIENHANPINIIAGGTLLDPLTLTIGFARRFTNYKRADLIFYDSDRLKKILNNRWRPVQIIFAGKAHPVDDEGKRMIQRIFNYAHDPSLGGRIAFVENYNEQLAQYMVHGVDVWLNNPIPPLEACGTSGMKASLNGVPHLSILDGWWIEGYNGNNGWAFKGVGDNSDAEAIYDLIEKKIIPLYYRVDEFGIPVEWVKVMKEAIKSIGSQFSARRMVKEYVQKFYQNALKSAK
ncbi:MAG: alpha-glucan family phosphorylase [Nitrospirae bacterium]|nr:alpha-glucan family phosphorylase [Nitrospirota bacterium]